MSVPAAAFIYFYELFDCYAQHHRTLLPCKRLQTSTPRSAPRKSAAIA
jgi:hypothetical protein